MKLFELVKHNLARRRCLLLLAKRAVSNDHTSLHNHRRLLPHLDVVVPVRLGTRGRDGAHALADPGGILAVPDKVGGVQSVQLVAAPAHVPLLEERGVPLGGGEGAHVHQGVGAVHDVGAARQALGPLVDLHDIAEIIVPIDSLGRVIPHHVVGPLGHVIAHQGVGLAAGPGQYINHGGDLPRGVGLGGGQRQKHGRAAHDRKRDSVWGWVTNRA
mmetsp:Transcript_28194/g.60021  ORF Transcript_28194/g.60021 Transcript_28194/m.60021 type:complete len:215 (+) Transcript_28194:1-645(+)